MVSQIASGRGEWACQPVRYRRKLDIPPPSPAPSLGLVRFCYFIFVRTMSRLFTSLDQFPDELRGGGLAIGNFDAVHLGHAALVRRLVALAAEFSGPAIVFTFDPPPGAVLRPTDPPIRPLTTIARRSTLFEKLGADGLIAYPTNREFLQLSAKDFFTKVVIEALGARVVVEGPNFRFGKGREGDTRMLAELCRAAKAKLELMSIIQADSDIVSSTRIRELVTLGQVQAANRLLYQPYRIEGEVVRGAERGRLIGFPTANLSSIPVLLPALGVYSGRVYGVEPRPLAAAVHIGPSPTFGVNEPKVEVHIVGWSGSLYGRTLEVELLERIRDVRRFPSVDELIAQLRLDVDQSVRTAAAHP